MSFPSLGCLQVSPPCEPRATVISGGLQVLYLLLGVPLSLRPCSQACPWPLPRTHSLETQAGWFFFSCEASKAIFVSNMWMCEGGHLQKCPNYLIARRYIHTHSHHTRTLVTQTRLLSDSRARSRQCGMWSWAVLLGPYGHGGVCVRGAHLCPFTGASADGGLLCPCRYCKEPS